MVDIPQKTRERIAYKLAQLAERHSELEQMLADPELVSDRARYADVAKEHGALGKFAAKHRELQSAIAQRREGEELLRDDGEEPGMRRLAEEEIAEAQQAEARVTDEALDLLVADAEDQTRNVIMEIRSGTGGEEAALFAADLFRMYSHYAQQHGWQIELLDRSVTDMGGFKELVFSISGKGAWRKLRFESGGHRVQRVPATESQGRIHTSLATVAVLPEAQEVDVQIDPGDLDVSFMRSQGPGGQNVNKVSSCVRIVHKPTGITVKCQEQKSQHKNRLLALKILRAKLYEESQRESKQKRDALRRSQVGSGDRNERIRTYNFPQDRVTDHRIGLDVFGIENVLMGNCDRIFHALEEWDKQARLSALTEQ